MEYAIGTILALAVAALAAAVKFDRDRAFYPTVLMVVASYYILFAAMAATGRTLLAEMVVCCIFSLAAIIGFKQSLWWVAAAIAGHGCFDFIHGWFIDNPGVPKWWPGFCTGFDVMLGALMAVRLLLNHWQRIYHEQA